MCAVRMTETTVEIYQLINYRRDHWGVYSGEPVTDPTRFKLAHTSTRLHRAGSPDYEILEAVWADIHTWSRFQAEVALKYMGVDLFASDVVVIEEIAYLRKAEGWQRLDWSAFLTEARKKAPQPMALTGR